MITYCFEVGQTWARRDGKEVEITAIDHKFLDELEDYPICGSDGIARDFNGIAYRGEISHRDLVHRVLKSVSGFETGEAKQELKDFEKWSEDNPVPVDIAKRFNSGKPDLSLLYPEAERQEALVWMKGEEKYGRDNWQKLWGSDTINLTCACALRHIMYMLDGEMIDQESGLPHAAHVKCNMTMIIKWLKDEGLLGG